MLCVDFAAIPSFALTAIVTLALGIGATTAVFSVVDRILFRALPYADPSQIVSVGMVHSLEHQEFLMGRFLWGMAEPSDALFGPHGAEHDGSQLRPGRR